MSAPSPGCGSCGSTLWATTTARGPVLSPRRPEPAARSRARCAGTTAGMTCTTTTASKSRSRRPVRTQVSGLAQLSALTVRGNGSTSGVPPGTACSPG